MIDEQVIRGQVLPDPDPYPQDTGGNTNMNILEMLNQCLSLASLARQWYEAVNTKPEVVSVSPFSDALHNNSLLGC